MGMLPWQTTFGFTFQDCPRPYLMAILDGCKLQNPNQQNKLSDTIILFDGNVIINVTLPLWKFSDFSWRQTVDIAGDITL